MAEARIFRSALNGFNREDVVRYIESLNAKHTALVNQLTSEKQSLADDLEILRGRTYNQTVSMADYEAAVRERDALLAQLEALKAEAADATRKNIEEEELAAYRRAEQVEREARERSKQMYRQAAATLADANAKVSDSVSLLDGLSGKITVQLTELQQAVTDSRDALQDTAEAIAAIGSEE